MGDKFVAGHGSTAAPVLRGDRAEDRSLLSALAQLWVGGTAVEWERLFDGSKAKRIVLPTYAFQRERYWLDSLHANAGDAASIGQVSTEHPLLGASVALAGGDGWLFTGCISLRSHPWLADCVVDGVVLLAGTAFLELVLRAGSEVECGLVEELVQEAPLVVPERGDVQLQVTVGTPDEFGRRSFEVYSRTVVDAGERVSSGEGWTRHASGVLADGEPARGGEPGEWPPVGAVALDLDGVYEDLAGLGLEYGPVFQGLGAAWRCGDELFAEVSLEDGLKSGVEGFLVHPALLDASLHALVAVSAGGGGPRVPFSWSGVSLRAVGASALRVRISPVGLDEVSIVATDENGLPVVKVDSLVLQAVTVGQLRDAGRVRGALDSLYGVEWVDVGPGGDTGDLTDGLVVVGGGDDGLARGLPGAGVFEDVASLGLAVESGLVVPEFVLFDCAEGRGVPLVEGVPVGVHERVVGVLGLLQEWLADERFVDSRLVVVTCGAVSVGVGEGVSDLAGAGVWGLVGSAQLEHPGRFVLLDTNGGQASLAMLPAALGCGEDRVVLRDDGVLVPRLAHAGSRLMVPEGVSEWCLGAGEDGSFDGLSLVEAAESGRALGVGEVRVGVRAAGLNFRDVLIALGVYPERASIGGEGAGVVLEVGPGVVEFELGDRVMGLFGSAFGPVAVADHRLLARVPDGWSFAQAASVPIVFPTAYYALVDLAGVEEGERLLVHAGTGGVGMATIQLARHLGVEVFATASEAKWDVLLGMGLDEDHIASSRDLGFAPKFLGVTGGDGMDVVLDCLAGEFVDASLGLLGDGGRFVEMGKADIRDQDEVADAHPGVLYRAFDLLEAGPERIQGILGELLALFERDALRSLPVTGWDVRHAREAFRFMSQARHVGKNVLTIPAPLDVSGTVLVTGGTGGLGGLLAEHLVSTHGVRRLLLSARRGLEAKGANELLERLSGLGAKVQIVACDVSDRAQVQRLLEGIDQEHPLSAIVHAAGVLDDGVLESLTPERVRDVLAPKVDGAWNLHELTRDLDLQAFILFSSVAGTLGSPGQASYAAANSFLDALVAQRRTQGLAGLSLAWGPWTEVGGMAESIGAIDRARIHSAGMVGLTPEKGLELFDSAHDLGDAIVVAANLDKQALRHQAGDQILPAILQGLIRLPARRAGSTASAPLAQRLIGATQPEREKTVLELVLVHTAAVLGYASPQAIEPTRVFKDLGFDSLMAVELRNRLAAASGLRLPATLLFDHPTPAAISHFVLAELERAAAGLVPSVDSELAELERRFSSIAEREEERAKVVARLGALLIKLDDRQVVQEDEDITAASADEVFELIDRELGSV